MKLISCYIENFGALSHYEHRFDSGLEMIHKENGTGKTTLSAFILAMLYGMDTHSQRDKEQKARNRYDPWQGGKYGGRLTLEAGGRIYRIERAFDTVSATKDKITVYDEETGEELSLKDEPGTLFLGITKEAFLATAFLSGKEHGSLSCLMPRLNGYLEGIEGTDRYEEAAKKLADASKEYAKQRGSGGRIDDVKKQIKQANEHLAGVRQAAENAEKYQDKLYESEKTCLPKKKRLQYLNEHAAKIERLNVLKDYEEKVSSAKKELCNFIEEHGDNFPDNATLAAYDSDLLTLKGLSDRAQKSEKDKQDEEYLSKHKNTLGTISKEDLDSAAEKIFRANAAKEKLSTLDKTEKSEEYRLLHSKFEKDLPSDKELELLTKIGKDLEKTALLVEHSRKEAEDKNALLKKVFVLFTALSVTCLVFAVAAFLFEPIVGTCLLLFTLLLCAGAIGVFAYRKKGQKNPYEGEYAKQSHHLRERLASFGYKGEDLLQGLLRLTEDRKSYLTLQKKVRDSKKEEASLLEEKEQLERELAAFFAPHGHEELSLSARLKQLREEYADYTLVASKAEEREKERASFIKQAKELETKLYVRLSCHYKTQPSDATPEKMLEELKNNTQLYRALSSVLASREADLEKYRSENDLTLPSNEVVPSPEEQKTLQEEIAVLEKEAAFFRAKLEEELERAAELPEAEAAIVHLHEKLDQVCDRKRILDLTAGFLKQAKDDLSNRYTKPIRQAYESFTKQIDEELSKGLAISPNDMSLQFERNGALRKNENFNSAFITLSNICMRLAMLKVAYPAERPFLILDDPFVYLDDANCAKALEALKELSKDTQILYFTCHSGRTI